MKTTRQPSVSSTVVKLPSAGSSAREMVTTIRPFSAGLAVAVESSNSVPEPFSHSSTKLSYGWVRCDSEER